MAIQMEKKLLKVVSKVAISTAQKTANTACIFLGYQPKQLQSVKNLRKF